MPNLKIVRPKLEKGEKEELAEGGEEFEKGKLTEEKEELGEKMTIREKGGPGTILEERRTEELLKETERKLKEAEKPEDEIKPETEQVAKKPSFEEFKAQQETGFQKKLEAARQKKDAAYENEDKEKIAA